MGHRANFVLIRGSTAQAYYDQWAALGSTFVFANGPDESARTAAQSELTSELMDWAFAEAGFLLDFDERHAIVFGYPEPLDIGLDDVEALELDDALGPEEMQTAAELTAALDRGPLDFLRHIAPQWSGWLLQWDERGVDAFAAHLQRRGIDSIKTAPASHPAEYTATSHQA